MKQKKICMLGSCAVGKSSLVACYIHDKFSETYLTTVGASVDTRAVTVSDETVNLILWDIDSEDWPPKIQASYLRGASGYLLVADGTRAVTVEAALSLQRRVETTLGPLPFLLLLNKSDLIADKEVDDINLQLIRQRGWTVIETSAKTGAGVEEAFQKLTERMVEQSGSQPAPQLSVA